MKKLSILFAILTIAAVSLFAQTVTLTFIGQDDANHYVRLDSVVVRNLTQGWQETLFWPDTVLIMQEGTGIEDYSGTNNASKIQLSQNTPNPFTGITFADMSLAEEGKVLVEVTDMAGRVIVFNNYPSLQKGLHQLRISLSTPGVYFLTARMNGNASSVKMINQSEGGADKIEYQGVVEKPQALCTPKSGTKDSTANPFHLGDEMEYVGFATVNSIRRESVHITQTQNESQTIELTFILPHDAQPCLGTPTVTDIDGNTYNTVWIGNQCWMKENLRTTHYADGTAITLASTSQSSFDVQFYYDPGNATNYGYLYNWAAAKGFGVAAVSANNQGICPTGWHVPSDDEWTHLTQYVESHSQYLCSNNSTYIAKALASSTGWNSSTYTCAVGNTPGSNNATGFSALPAGHYYPDNTSFYGSGSVASFWSSTEIGSYDSHWKLLCDYKSLFRDYGYYKKHGYSVRCLRDVVSDQTQPIATTFTATNITGTSATLNGTVSNPDNVTITTQGFQWKTTQGGAYTTVNTTGTAMFYNLIGLTSNTSYTYRAFVTTAAGTYYGGEVTFTATASIGGVDAQPCPGTPTVTDIDGNTYNTVWIGNQCWMKENLRTTKYADGTIIEQGDSISYVTPYWYYPDSNASNISTYGLLYNWKAVMHNSSSSSANPSGVQGICPTGWHVPSDAEWTQLTDYVGAQSQYQCYGSGYDIAKAMASTTGWCTAGSVCAVGNNQNSNNVTGFSALPAGIYYGGYYDFGSYAWFWSSTEDDSDLAWCGYLCCHNAGVDRIYYDEFGGFSVRCVRDSLNGDNTTQTQPIATTFTATNITDTSATLNGTVSNPYNVTITAQGFEWKTTQDGTFTAVNVAGTVMSYNLTGLASNTSYIYRAFVTTATGTNYGGEVTFTTTVSISTEPCPGTPTVTDIDGNTYNTLWIGNQCWMKENLRTTKYADGTSIALGSTTSTTTAYRYYPNNIASNVSLYGYLYNWPAVMGGAASSAANPSGVLGICPYGWHVPSDAEWTQLTDYVSSQSQYVCGNTNTSIAKALASTTGWCISSNTCAVGNNQSSNNVTGFSAFPAGRYSGSYDSSGYNARFWSSTENSSSKAYYRDLSYCLSFVGRTPGNREYGYSIRCLRD